MTQLSPEVLTVERFWRQIDRLNWYSGHTGDEPLGWRMLWRERLQTVVFYSTYRLPVEFTDYFRMFARAS